MIPCFLRSYLKIALRLMIPCFLRSYLEIAFIVLRLMIPCFFTKIVIYHSRHGQVQIDCSKRRKMIDFERGSVGFTAAFAKNVKKIIFHHQAPRNSHWTPWWVLLTWPVWVSPAAPVWWSSVVAPRRWGRTGASRGTAPRWGDTSCSPGAFRPASAAGSWRESLPLARESPPPAWQSPPPTEKTPADQRLNDRTKTESRNFLLVVRGSHDSNGTRYWFHYKKYLFIFTGPKRIIDQYHSQVSQYTNVYVVFVFVNLC